MMELLTVKEVAAMLRVTPSTLYRLIYDHDFPNMRIGGDYRVSKELLEKWIDERTVWHDERAHHHSGRRRGSPFPQESR